jgi:hypothetical protein
VVVGVKVNEDEGSSHDEDISFSDVIKLLEDTSHEENSSYMENSTYTENSSYTEKSGHADDISHHGGIHLVSWKWMEYEQKIMITLTILVAVLISLYFHRIPIISSLPESCFLILLGTGIGFLILATDGQNFPKLTHGLFFNFLLPPIILDAAFTLYNRNFIANFPAIVTFAVLGTVITTLLVGFSLHGLASADLLGKMLSDSTEHHLKPVEVRHYLKTTHSYPPRHSFSPALYLQSTPWRFLPSSMRSKLTPASTFWCSASLSSMTVSVSSSTTPCSPWSAAPTMLVSCKSSLHSPHSSSLCLAALPSVSALL